jgi:hypothetical protein
MRFLTEYAEAEVHLILTNNRDSPVENSANSKAACNEEICVVVNICRTRLELCILHLLNSWLNGKAILNCEHSSNRIHPL